MLREAAPGTGVLGAQVLLPDGRTNAGDNPIHITGIAWAGRYREPAEHGPPRPVAAVSGAALLARARAFADLGGMCERFFMYQDDVDLCWRMRLAGWGVVLCPDAAVWHEYEFEKGPGKWYLLERNRLWSVLSNYSASTLLLLGPLLVCAELPAAALAIRERRVRGLVGAWTSTVLALPELMRWRLRVQASRRIPDSQVLELMTGRFETAALSHRALGPLNSVTEALRLVLIRVLRVADR
jgi:GT2 family glycosyltransferase